MAPQRNSHGRDSVDGDADQVATTEDPAAVRGFERRDPYRPLPKGARMVDFYMPTFVRGRAASE